jgi:predicted DNA-binding protein
MAHSEAVATKLPLDLKRMLDRVCEKLGLRKNYVIEMALREKLEDLMDANDLQIAVKEATGFHSWSAVKKTLKLGKK